MFVNAILHHEVPVFYEKPAKFFPEPALEPARIPPSARFYARRSMSPDGYKISAYERTASARRHFRELSLEFERPPGGDRAAYRKERRDLCQQAARRWRDSYHGLGR